MTATARLDGDCHVSLLADGTTIRQLSAHVGNGTAMRVYEYPAESRVVLILGDHAVSVFLPVAELGRLIDALNDSYTRVARRPHLDEREAV